MRYLKYSDKEEFPIVFLVQSINKKDLEEYYFKDLNKDNILTLDLYYEPGKKKTPAAIIKQYLEEEIIPILKEYKTKYVIVSDQEYFKVLAKVLKVDLYLGYVMKSPYGDFQVFYIPNYKAVFFNPDIVKEKINYVIKSLKDSFTGSYKDPGTNIIHSCDYPKTIESIKYWLDKFIKDNVPLTCDIETFSLKHYDSGLGTITFCWNQHEGIAFPIDYYDGNEKDYSKQVRELLKDFFINFKNKLIFHNISFDVYILIYQLFMKNLNDTEGMLYGLDVMLKNWEDTKLITYLATNSCAGNHLGLKYQAQEFSGNYAIEEIGDITKRNLNDVLKYNLIDGLSTWYVYNKYYQKMIDDQQLDIYENLFKPTTKDIIQMQLVGMPIDRNKVEEIKVILNNDIKDSLSKIMSSKFVKDFEYSLRNHWVEVKNKTLKKKKVTIEDCDLHFNPNSGKQLQRLLYTDLKLPIINLTKSKLPSVDKDTLAELIFKTDNEDIKNFLQSLVDYAAVNKIISSFIPAFEKAVDVGNGYRLFGNFNLGGTVSGRLSSSEPNLQQLPATGTKYAKLIKKCFKAPTGWLFCGLDFASLEDRISALTTKDPNKLKVYSEGYDGHCLRAFFYFREEMPDIEDTLESINSIKSKYKHLRQESKGPTFALTYAGTYRTLMSKFGFSEERAKKIEAKYHELYKVSDEWVKAHLDQASKDGYVTCAFGLRLRTPLLKQVVKGTSKTPYEAEAEGRTAGNALGQSWCLLNNRAGIEFNSLVRSSKYKYDILPVAMIHDAQYFLIRDDPEVVTWANKNLVKAVQWQDDPAIYHDVVKLGGEFSIFYPDWAHELSIPNKCDENQLIDIVNNYMETLND